MSIVTNLINKKTNNKQPKALCCFYDGRFDSELANLGIKLFGVKEHSVYNWCESYKSDNIQLIQENEIQNYTYDFVLCNDIIAHRDHLLNFTRGFHLPGLFVGHETYRETPFHLQKRLQEANADMIMTTYGNQGLFYGVEPLKDVKKDIPIMIEGNFQEQDYAIINHIKKEIPELVLIGKNPGLSFSLQPLSYNQYKEYFARCKIFINLPTQQNISYQLLWAMSNGALPISLKTDLISDLFTKSGGLCAIDHNGLINTAKQYINKEITVGERSRFSKVNNIFSMEKFKNGWSNIINDYSKRIFKI